MLQNCKLAPLIWLFSRPGGSLLEPFGLVQNRFGSALLNNPILVPSYCETMLSLLRRSKFFGRERRASCATKTEVVEQSPGKQQR